MKKIAYTVIFLLIAAVNYAQTHTRVFDENIRTLRAAREVILLDEPEPMQISFDDSDLLSGEYLRGFTTQDIVNYAHSINTSREYTHYWFEFPNEEMQILLSGQYRLTIYEDNDPDKKVAEVDLCVVEPKVKIEANVRSNTDEEFNGRYQQIDIDVNTAALNVRDPNEVRVEVVQNNRLDNAVSLTQPTYFEPKRMRYINRKDLIFEGGNEYHHFDAFSTYFAGTGIDRVYFEGGDYHVLLFADEVAKGSYISSPDANGRYLVNAERTQDSDTEAEYMWVHWTLPAANPWFDGSLYVGGDIFNNEMNLRNRMQYDNDARCYWLTALVKQGGYDYQYWFVPKESKVESQKSKAKTTTQRVDGSYWQTGNEYAIYVWWRPFGARYDRLVGVSVVR